MHVCQRGQSQWKPNSHFIVWIRPWNQELCEVHMAHTVTGSLTHSFLLRSPQNRSTLTTNSASRAAPYKRDKMCTWPTWEWLRTSPLCQRCRLSIEYRQWRTEQSLGKKSPRLQNFLARLSLHSYQCAHPTKGENTLYDIKYTQVVCARSSRKWMSNESELSEAMQYN